MQKLKSAIARRDRYPEEFAAAIILILRRFAANSQSRIPD